MKLFFVAAAASFSLSSFAQNSVDVQTPGSLSSLISDLTASSLTISGSINAQDIYFIGQNLSSLSSLDLSNASIVAYSGEKLNGQDSYDANLIPTGAFSGTSISEFVFPSQGNISVGDFAFAATQLTSLSIPDNVVSIGQAAYASCSALKSVVLNPETVLDSYVFSNCANLQSADLNFSTTIAASQFANCSSLATLENAELVTSIGDYAFMGCTSLTAYSFNDNIKTIGEGAFLGSALSAADFTNATSLTSIGAKAFAFIPSLKSVTFNADQEISLGEGVLFACTNLSSITLPAINTLADFALTDTSSLKTVTLPQSLSYLGENAMAGMSALSTVDATALTSVPDLGDEVWRNVEQANIPLLTTTELKDSFREAEQWQNFKFDLVSNSVDAITASESDIKGRIVGNDIEIKASGAELANVAVYDPAGILLTSVNPNADFISISTADFQTRIYIITVTLKGGVSATLKLIRK